MVDVYCGAGTISLCLAEKAKHVLGIEIVEAAILDAKENAQRNHFTNVEFVAADAALEMPKRHEQGLRPDVIVFDPPRSGCERRVLSGAAAMNPSRMVYVSCSPQSLARDLASRRVGNNGICLLGHVRKHQKNVDVNKLRNYKKEFTKTGKLYSLDDDHLSRLYCHSS